MPTGALIRNRLVFPGDEASYGRAHGVVRLCAPEHFDSGADLTPHRRDRFFPLHFPALRQLGRVNFRTGTVLIDHKSCAARNVFLVHSQPAVVSRYSIHYVRTDPSHE